MIHRLIQSILFLVLVGIAANAQVRGEHEPSLQERASKLEPFIDQSARRYGIDQRILRILCFLESRYRLDAISPKGARGPMQFMPATANRYGLRNPHDPKMAIDAGAQYIGDLLRKFNGRLDLALAAYNAGEGTVEAFMRGRSIRLSNGKIVNPSKTITGGIPPYRETQAYVRTAIALLVNRPTPTARHFVFSLEINKNTVDSTSRDFTIDVMANERVFSLRFSEKAKSLFIEIQ
jgi:soluble lytic murein transglycosylase-like protein